MRIRIVAPIMYLSLEDDTTIQIDNFQITNDKEIVRRMASSKNFVSKIGEMHMKMISENTFFYFEGDYRQIPEIIDCTSGYEVAHIMCGYFYNLVSKLWFLNNNSAFVYECFVEEIEIGTEGLYYNIRDVFNSNSQGEYSSTKLQLDQVEQFKDIIKKVLIYQIIKNEIIPKIPQLNPNLNTAIPAFVNYTPYDGDRISRAMYFLQIARACSNLIIKITYFIAIYECIFTSNSSDVSYNVRTRAAHFLGGDIIASTKLIKDAYDVRSKYIHGEMIPSERSKLVIISSSIDQLTRDLFNKIIADTPDFLNFLEDKNGKKDFEKYFEHLAKVKE